MSTASRRKAIEVFENTKRIHRVRGANRAYRKAIKIVESSPCDANRIIQQIKELIRSVPNVDEMRIKP